MTTPSTPSILGAERFSFADAVGGWRGLVESTLPGLVFVVVFVATGTFSAPVIAALAVVAGLVAVRLIQRTAVAQALSGVVGVVLGAVWAWRTGSASGYFVPGLWANAGYLAAAVVSILVRWPLVGIVVGIGRGWGTRWRDDRAVTRLMSVATLIVAAIFALRLAVQVPLYLADEVAALGTAKLVMGVPLFALGLWVTWLVVRSATLAPAPADPHQPT